jgi:hypothetical protein
MFSLSCCPKSRSIADAESANIDAADAHVARAEARMGSMADPIGGGKNLDTCAAFVTDGHGAKIIVAITAWQIVVGRVSNSG